MASIFTPTNFGAASGPYRIDLTDCMGDSLQYINANTNYLDSKINTLNSLINTLSSNMNQITNVPYARLAELPGKDTAISNLRTITGSSSTSINQPAQLIFPINSSVTLTRYLTLIDTPANYINTIGLTKNVDRSISLPSTGTYEIYVQTPAFSVHNAGAWASVDVRLIDDGGNVILGGIPVSIDTSTMFPFAELRGRFTVTNTATKYFVQIRRNQAGQSFGLCAALPDTVGAGTLFNVELWKLG
jgi:hypothetical protein